MRGTPVLVLFLAAMLAPQAIAQEPVAQCKRQCEPTAPDVNKAVVENGTTNVILYAHWEDLLGSVPMNTMPPDPVREPDLNKGFLMPILNASAGACPARACDVNFDNGWFTFHLCTGEVTWVGGQRRDDCFDSAFKGGVASGEPLVLYWYMSLSPVPGRPTEATTAAAMPQVGVFAQLRNPEMRLGGRVIASSEGPGPFSASRVDMLAVPGQPNVYEFRVELDVLDQNWNGYSAEQHADGNGRNVALDVLVYQIHDGNGNQAAQPDWRLRTGTKFPTRLIAPILDPLEVTSAGVTREQAAGVRARFSVFPTFGAYDADPESFRLVVEGPANVSAERIGAPLVRHPYDGHGPPRPLNVSYPVDLSGLPAGAYRFRFEAMNLQKTYRDHADATYEWTIEEAASLPGPSIASFGALFLVGLALHVALRDRRAGPGHRR